MHISIKESKIGTKFLCCIDGKLEVITKRSKWGSNKHEYCGMKNGLTRTIYPYKDVLENIICVLENGNGKDLTDTVDDNKKDFELLEKYLQRHKEMILE